MKQGRGFRQQLRSSGFSLIEVSVALLVFSIGVVGFAALQLSSVQQVEETYSRGQAMAIAQDFIERARVNSGRDAWDYYLQATSWHSELPQKHRCIVTESVPDSDDACDSLTLAKADVFEVRSSLDGLLDRGKIEVAPCASVYCVTVAWSETQLDDCDQSAFSEGAPGEAAHCVRVEFIP